MRRLAIFMVLALMNLALAACAAPAELRQADTKACQDRGPASPASANCMQKENRTGVRAGEPGFGGWSGFAGAGVGLGF